MTALLTRIRRYLAQRRHKHAVWRLQVARLELADAKQEAYIAEQRVIFTRQMLKSL